MKIEFEFDDEVENYMPLTGTAVIAIMDEGGIRYATGHYGEPTLADSAGQALFLWEDAKNELMGYGEYEED